MASNTRVTRTMLGMLEAGERARLLQEVGAAPVERLLVAVGLGPHAHGRVAVAEVEGVVFLEGDRGAEVDVLGLVGDAEAARARPRARCGSCHRERYSPAERSDCPRIPSRPARRLRNSPPISAPMQMHVATRWPQQWVSQKARRPPTILNCSIRRRAVPWGTPLSATSAELRRAALSIARLGHGHQFNPIHDYVGRYARFCSLRRLSCCSR